MRELKVGDLLKPVNNYDRSFIQLALFLDKNNARYTQVTGVFVNHFNIKDVSGIGLDRIRGIKGFNPAFHTFDLVEKPIIIIGE